EQNNDITPVGRLNNLGNEQAGKHRDKCRNGDRLTGDALGDPQEYQNRALLLVKGGCAVNCRYCFRRHFPYAENQGNKRNWKVAL
ncbi:hypothetical protein MJL22_26290, partial [Salmonella enterica subsp. enterica serovar Montevideo]|nr:hypothetical protein [Salmonella enterica subsp. enterica serovar Montevideo]